MLSVRLNHEQIHREIDRICDFISQCFPNGESVVVGISGGVDSDAVTRLAVRTLGSNRIKLFTIIQEGTNPRHLDNARNLAREISVRLVEINMTDIPLAIMSVLGEADPDEGFRPKGLTDLSIAKNSLRTTIVSAYLNHGYLVLGTSNRTELETGFFVPLGDGLGHVKPMVHLYKTQVYQIAEVLGTRREVIEQPASSGNWIGAEDLEDLSFWLYNEAPLGRPVNFDAKAMSEVISMRVCLTTERLDLGLLGLARGLDDQTICEQSELPLPIITRLRRLTAAAQKLNRRPLGIRLENLS
jgi:NAD+ synthase